MKRITFLPAVIALVLVIVASSCTPMRDLEGQYPDRPVSNRIYVDDPYRGTVVLERDPYTGRYYEVNTYGYNRYGSGFSRGYRNYPRNNNYYYRNNGWRNHSNNGGYQQPTPPTQEQIRDRQKNKEDARKKILGN